jgi:hypothetical protein
MSRRAVSPAIATIFLIGVAVVGSVAAGNAMFQQNEISQKITKLDLVDASLIKITPTKTYFAATVKNSGTTIFASVSVSFIDDSSNSHTIASYTPLSPGEQFGNYLVDVVSVSFGKRYLVSIDGITLSGSTFRSADTIMVRG